MRLASSVHLILKRFKCTVVSIHFKGESAKTRVSICEFADFPSFLICLEGNFSMSSLKNFRDYHPSMKNILWKFEVMMLVCFSLKNNTGAKILKHHNWGILSCSFIASIWLYCCLSNIAAGFNHRLFQITSVLFFLPNKLSPFASYCIISPLLFLRELSLGKEFFFSTTHHKCLNCKYALKKRREEKIGPLIMHFWIYTANFRKIFPLKSENAFFPMQPPITLI